MQNEWDKLIWKVMQIEKDKGSILCLLLGRDLKKQMHVNNFSQVRSSNELISQFSVMYLLSKAKTNKYLALMDRMRE